MQSSGVIESDEDDVPLSALAKNGKPESDGGGAPASSLPACQPPATATPVASTTGASVPAQYENDDDMPISKLMRYPNLVFAHAKKRKEGQSKQTEGNGSGGQVEEKSKKVKQEPPGEEEDASRSQEGGAKKKKKRKDGDGDSGGAMSGNGKSKVTRNSAANKSAAHGQRTQDFYMLDKGELVQKLLRRWWYAIQWPDSSCATQVRRCRNRRACSYSSLASKTQTCAGVAWRSPFPASLKPPLSLHPTATPRLRDAGGIPRRLRLRARTCHRPRARQAGPCRVSQFHKFCTKTCRGVERPVVEGLGRATPAVTRARGGES